VTVYIQRGGTHDGAAIDTLAAPTMTLAKLMQIVYWAVMVGSV
jgi:hypothetical protein